MQGAARKKLEIVRQGLAAIETVGVEGFEPSALGALVPGRSVGKLEEGPRADVEGQRITARRCCFSSRETFCCWLLTRIQKQSYVFCVPLRLVMSK